jgi:hypothetical protein
MTDTSRIRWTRSRSLSRQPPPHRGHARFAAPVHHQCALRPQCRLALLPSRALRVQIALEFSKLPEILGRDKPTVIT